MLPKLDDDIMQRLDVELETIVKRLKGSLSDLDIVTISSMGSVLEKIKLIYRMNYALTCHDMWASKGMTVGKEWLKRHEL